MIGIIDGVDLAILVDAGLARVEPVLLRRLELGVFGIGAVVLALPLDHVGVMRCLAVDRPGGAVVMRRRHPRLVIDMGEHLEAECLVLVKQLEPARHVLAAVLAHEVGVRQQALEIDPHCFAPGGAGVAAKVRAAIRDELVKIIGHRGSPYLARDLIIGWTAKERSQKPGWSHKRVYARLRRAMATSGSGGASCSVVPHFASLNAGYKLLPCVRRCWRCNGALA